MDHSGNVYLSDSKANRVHMISPSGAVSTIAGNGTTGYSGDGGPATAAPLDGPTGLAVDSSGALYIADYQDSRIRKVSGGTITTVAGNGKCGYSGDGGPAIGAEVCWPSGLAVDSSGNLYIADSSYVVRKISAAGTITTFAGNGTSGYSGDGGPATAAQLGTPDGVAVDGSGNVYIADNPNNCIRKVDSNGIITTFAGTGVAGFAGDNGPAAAARLSGPAGLALDLAGNLYIADSANVRVRVVTPGGIIATIAGGSSSASPGDGGPALNAFIWAPQALAVDPAGNVYIAVDDGRAARLLTPQGGPALLTVSSTHNGSFPLGSTGQYALTVSNAPLAGSTSGTVTVSELPAAGLSVSSMSGGGWSCGGNSCTRTDALAAGASYPAIGVVVNISGTAPSQATNRVTVAGGGAALEGAQDFTTLTAPPTTLATSPPGLQTGIDGLPARTAPQTLSLLPGWHLIAAPSPQAGGPGMQYAFANWSDFGAATHSIEVTGTAATYTANFKTQYQLTTASVPGGAGTVSPATGSFFDGGSSVTVTAAGMAPYTFSYWGGAAAGNASSASVILSAPEEVVANFVSCDLNGDGHVDTADVQLILDEALGKTPPIHDLNHDGVVNVVDVQKLTNAVLR